MISLANRINAFSELGHILLEVGLNQRNKSYDNEIVNLLDKTVIDATHYNGWFIEENVRFMLTSIGKSLEKNNIIKWIEPYKNKLESNQSASTIGVVMAGNIPIVGFHDFLSVIMSGNNILAKLSSDDNKLLPIIADILISIEPDFSSMITFTSGLIKKMDAIIATGSNNSSRYFEYYFGKYPNIIRRSRNGIAVLTGDESEEELKNLSNDIFMYYGLGCRSVSHILVSSNYDFMRFLDVCTLNTQVSINHKYFNNYEYNKAIYLVNSKNHFDTGNLLLTEDGNFASPVSVVNYEYYTDIKHVNSLLETNNSKIQCILSNSKDVKDAIPLGTSQSPELWDYADGIDTMEFLTNLQSSTK